MLSSYLTLQLTLTPVCLDRAKALNRKGERLFAPSSLALLLRQTLLQHFSYCISALVFPWGCHVMGQDNSKSRKCWNKVQLFEDSWGSNALKPLSPLALCSA